MKFSNDDIAEIRGLLERSVKTWESINAYKAAIDKLDAISAELLSLRTGEGDEEVERVTNEIIYQLQTEDILKLRDIAIARGQQLQKSKSDLEQLGLWFRQIEDENTRLEQDLAKLKADYAFSQEQLREAQAEVERLKGCLKKANDGFEEYERRYYLELNKTEELQSQLAAMQAASVEEVDAIVAEFQFRSDMPMNNHAFEGMEKLARTFYARNAELVGLLNSLRTAILEINPEYKIPGNWKFGTSSRRIADLLASPLFLEIVAASDAESESEVGR